MMKFGTCFTVLHWKYNITPKQVYVFDLYMANDNIFSLTVVGDDIKDKSESVIDLNC